MNTLYAAFGFISIAFLFAVSLFSLVEFAAR
jgi:hypothetical protein